MKKSRTKSFIIGSLSAGFFAAIVACSSSSTPAPVASNPLDGSAGDSASTTNDNAAGTATITGTLDGKSYTNMGAIALKGVYDSEYPGIVEILMAADANMCATAQEIEQQGGEKASYFIFGFTLGQTVSTSTVVPGVYGTGGPAVNEMDTAGWDSYDATCTDTAGPGYSTATVTLTSVDPYIGTFDVAFENGDHVTGSFNAPLCDLPPPPEAGAGAGPCITSQCASPLTAPKSAMIVFFASPKTIIVLGK